MSGLAAAYYFRKRTVPQAKIGILDNHDDFGGHARRNEFTVGGRLLIARGGTSYIERPATFPLEGRELLADIGVDYKEPTASIDQRFYPSLGLRGATYFDKETFGVDKFVVNPASMVGLGGGRRGPSSEFLAQTPLSAHVQKELLRLYNDKRDYLPGLSNAEKLKTLRKTSYKDYLLNVVKLHPDVLAYFHPGGKACPSPSRRRARGFTSTRTVRASGAWGSSWSRTLLRVWMNTPRSRTCRNSFTFRKASRVWPA